MTRPFFGRGHATPAAAAAALQRLAQAGEPVALQDLDALAPDEALGLLRVFLHDPGVRGPVEPFAALLAGMVERRAVGLWDLLPAEGAQAFLASLPREQPRCLSCRCFYACEGYGAWAGSCATWAAVLLELGAAAGELARLRRSGSGAPEPSRQAPPGA